MILKLYAIHDQAVKEYIGPEPARTHGEAERRFRTNVNNPQNGMLHSNPEHFSLYYIGDFDTKSGKVGTWDEQKEVMLPAPKEPHHIISAAQCKDQGDNVAQMRVPGT